MRDRLIEVLDGFSIKCFTHCNGKIYGGCKSCHTGQIADHLIENGVIVPPVKIGQIVFAITPSQKIYEYTVNGIHQFEDSHFMFGAYRIREDGKKVNPTWQESDIGKTVFLTKEEAETKLKELNNSV